MPESAPEAYQKIIEFFFSRRRNLFLAIAV